MSVKEPPSPATPQSGPPKRGRRQAAYYTFGGSMASTIIVSVQAVVLIPLYLHAAGPRLYGAWLGSGDILLWLSAFDFGLPNLIIQKVGRACGTGDDRRAAEYLATGIVMLAGLALLVWAGGSYLAFFIPGWMGLSGSQAETLRGCVLVGVAAAALVVGNNAVIGYCRGAQDTAFIYAVQVVSSLAGFAVSLALVLTGFGLWAVSFGMLARSIVLVVGSVAYLIRRFGGRDRRLLGVRLPLLLELAKGSPAVFAAVLAGAAPLDTAMVAILTRPELAAVYNLTRKAADVANSVTGMVGQSTFGGFSHLVNEEPARTIHVHREIVALFVAVAVSLSAAYIVVNGSLVTVWLGAPQYGGSLLTVLIGLGMVVSGRALLVSNLYRFAGPMVRGSLVLVLEAVSRYALMAVLLTWLGLAGVPLAGMVTAGIAGAATWRWTRKRFASVSVDPGATSATVLTIRATCLALAVALCFAFRPASWVYVLGAGTLTVAVVGATTFGTDSRLARYRQRVVAILPFTGVPRQHGSA